MHKKVKSALNKKNQFKELTFKELLEKLEDFFQTFSEESFSEDFIVNTVTGRSKIMQDAVKKALKILIKSGKIREKDPHSYQSASAPEIYEGVIDHVNPRFAYVVSEAFELDPIITSQNLLQSLDGDIVKFIILVGKKSRAGDRQEAKVIEIVKRKRVEFVGRVSLYKSGAFVIMDNKKIHNDFFIYPEDMHGAQHDQKVIVRFLDWLPGDKNPVGKIIKVLGTSGENEVEIHSIMVEYGLPMEFEPDVIQEAATIAETIPESEIEKRKDFRHVTTFTIDPFDAKDFDDALSVRKLGEDTFEIGVHIADVSHYVKPGTKLEAQAFHRGTSVYLVDRCLPMLPEKLSNDICSLKPHVDRLTFSAVFTIDKECRIVNAWYGRTVIHSNRRFTYEEAQQVLETHTGDYVFEITLLDSLAKKLKEKRFKNGAVNFETTEVKFTLDEKGKPTGVYVKERKDAHKLIEEFMLLANKKVAEFCYHYKNGKDSNIMVYRTHDNPDPEKLRTFSQFASKFGYTLNPDSHKISTELNQMMDSLQGKPEQNMLENLAVRAMAKAKYTTEAKGHFGLAFDHYTHFTSPIRRYPDLMVHRLLQDYLDGRHPQDRKEWEERCKYASEREKLAADAERASIKFKQAEYMSTMIGTQFEGIISGVTEWGVFVEIAESKCEGLVRMQDIKDDFYELDLVNYRIVGRRRGQTYTFGDKVRVQVKATDVDKRTIDLLLLTTE